MRVQRRSPRVGGRKSSSSSSSASSAPSVQLGRGERKRRFYGYGCGFGASTAADAGMDGDGQAGGRSEDSSSGSGSAVCFEVEGGKHERAVRARLLPPVDFFTPGRPGGCGSKEPKVVYFMRHGQSDGNKDKSDPLDTTLTALGRKQASGWSKLVSQPDSDHGLGRIDCVICSPLRRTMHTAALAFGSRHTPKVCRYARERWWHYAQCRGCSPADRESFVSQLPCPIEGADSLDSVDEFWNPAEEGKLAQSELSRRSKMGLLRLLKCIDEQQGTRVAVVTHYGVIEHLLGVCAKNGDVVVAMLENGVFEKLHHLHAPVNDDDDDDDGETEISKTDSVE